ncbi:TetR family transcriptional regulator [Nocardia sp. SYP-A9097]|uniref:TetR/AcrR family transcriptional regulator n=1 Tax=Nocardia sp. SYP-A9097 TaxID=2663237 RepID=UPI00129A78AB|nr:TetR family transcriptional regulator [Nocardia sp. SYP-A9097]MRH89387.1 TetR family transcriptional regulator [Nocardia sp. SYP-A9097]
MARTRDAEVTGPASRARIIGAAITLFAANGYPGTSLIAVARAAGISQSGLLHHFPDKEVLLTGVLAEMDRQTLESVDADREYEGPALVRAFDIIEAIVARNQQNRELIKLVHVGIFNTDNAPEAARVWAQERLHRMRTDLSGLIEQAVSAGEARADVDPAALASVIIATISGLEEQWLIDDSFDMVSAIRGLTDILRRDLLSSSP